MKPWSVYVSNILPDYVQQDLRNSLDVTFNESGTILSLDELLHRAAGHQALLTTVAHRYDKAFFSRAPASLRVLATYSVGLDHIDLEAAREHGMAVLHTPDVLTNAVAECAFLLILGVARRATESADLIRSGAWTGWTPLQLNGFELAGKTLGVLGYGRIGRAIADRARAFGMTIAYTDGQRMPAELEKGAAFHPTAESLLPQVDVLVLAAPATAETKGFLNRSRIELMRSNAVVVNVSRGTLVDDDALITALQEKRIFGAGLDVFNNEPAIDPRYRDLPNAYITPHIGSSTVEARRRMGQILIAGLHALMEGQSPTNRVV